MKQRGFKIFVVAVFSLASHISIAHCHDLLATWEQFWNFSCEFKDIVSRSRRSVINEPNYDDPAELFNYLYPLADVSLEMLENEKRSSDSPLSVTSWIDDLIDLWESHCHSRNTRAKRSTRRRPMSTRRSNDDSTENSIKLPYDVEVGLENVTSTEAPDSAESTTPTSTTEKPADKPAKKVIADTDTFFAQYGGDIEYFFPLISFGIPFDGEITFLGFHGFKGIFPYR